MLTVDYVSEYRDHTKHTIVPRLFNEWAAILGIASVLSKQVWIDRGYYKVYPNLYVMLIGKPGTGKGTTANILKGVLENASFTKFAPNKTTLQKFLTDLEAGFEHSHSSAPTGSQTIDQYFSAFESTGGVGGTNGRLCSDVLILCEEFNNFMGADNIDFISLLTELWSYVGTYRDRIKTGKSVSIHEPCINLLGGNTHEGFSMAFPSRLLGQGFLARFILVYGSLGHTSEIAFPDSPRDDSAQRLGSLLQEIQNTTTGVLTIEDSTRVGAGEILKYYSGPDDARFENYKARRFVQFLKLSICFAASAGERAISAESLVRANTLLFATESEMGKALGEFGKSKNSEISNKIMQHLYAAHAPVDLKHIWKLVSNDLNKNTEMTDIIQGLIGAEKIKMVTIPGTKLHGYLPNIVHEKVSNRDDAKQWIDGTYYNYLLGM